MGERGWAPKFLYLVPYSRLTESEGLCIKHSNSILILLWVITHNISMPPEYPRSSAYSRYERRDHNWKKLLRHPRKNEAINNTTTVRVAGEDGGIALPKQLFLLPNPMAALRCSGKIYYLFLPDWFSPRVIPNDHNLKFSEWQAKFMHPAPSN